MKRNMKAFLAVITLSIAGFLLFWGIRSWGTVKQGQDDNSPVVTASGRGNPTQQPNTVHLDDNARKASGIKTVVLADSTGRKEAEISVVILSAQELLDLRNSYIADQLQVEKAKASLHASDLEYHRLTQLNKEDKNVSDKAVEAEAATFQSDQAALRNAEQVQALLLMSAKQHWGTVVSGWIEHGPPVLQDIFETRKVLVQASLPLGRTAPSDLPIRIGSKTISADLVSALPHIDPRFQVPSYIYCAAAKMNQLVPGMNVTAMIANGPVLKGVRVPEDAILWWQGESWVYVETKPGIFLRKEIPQEDISSNGWFVQEGLHSGDRVVVVGAQQLLSEEFHTQTSAAVGDDD